MLAILGRIEINPQSLIPPPNKARTAQPVSIATSRRSMNLASRVDSNVQRAMRSAENELKASLIRVADILVSLGIAQLECRNTVNNRLNCPAANQSDSLPPESGVANIQVFGEINPQLSHSSKLTK